MLKSKQAARARIGMHARCPFTVLALALTGCTSTFGASDRPSGGSGGWNNDHASTAAGVGGNKSAGGGQSGKGSAAGSTPNGGSAAGSAPNGGSAAGSAPNGGSSSTANNAWSGVTPASTPRIPVPEGGKLAPSGSAALPLSDAPTLGDVHYVANRSSVRLYLPGSASAHDYRVFAVEGGVAVSVDAGNREHVSGANIHCAGLRQRNQCDSGEVLPLKYNNELLDMPVCDQYRLERRPNVPTALMQTLDVNGIGPNTTLVIEAIDRQCPFPGLFGTKHVDVPIFADDVGPKNVQAVINDKSYSLKLLPDTFPLRTEAEIRAQYGSMIFNGQGPNQPTLDPQGPNFPESPYIRVGHPAPANDPVVLARAIVQVSPTGNATPLEGFKADDYFDDFDDNSDQPKLLRSTDPANAIIGIGAKINVFETKKWVLYDVANQFSDFFVDRGQLNMVFGDGSQATMSLQAMYPKRPVRLPLAADEYLHVTYEVQRNESARRYENLTLCGADQVGQTYDGITPKAAPTPHPGFMNETETARTSILGWNCLLLIPRGGGYGALPGGDITSHADSSLKITVVRTSSPPTAANYDSEKLSRFATAFGPTQEPSFPRRWLRQIDESGKPAGPWLDDQLNVLQRTRFDVFIRRDRVLIYVDGEQRVCQQLDPSTMTMAEGALGFWHILYHTSAEFTELRRGLEGDNPSTGQHHILHNVPFADHRSYDNVGFRENVSAPAGFKPYLCYPAITTQ
jgi:hypothetical protein